MFLNRIGVVNLLCVKRHGSASLFPQYPLKHHSSFRVLCTSLHASIKHSRRPNSLHLVVRRHWRLQGKAIIDKHVHQVAALGRLILLFDLIEFLRGFLVANIGRLGELIWFLASIFPSHISNKQLFLMTGWKDNLSQFLRIDGSCVLLNFLDLLVQH